MDDFVVEDYRLDPHAGDQAPPHIHHGSDEAFVVIDGEVEFLIGAQRRRVGPGTLVEIPKGTVHTFGTVDDVGARVLIVMTHEIASLIAELHQPGATEDTWTRHRSEVVDDPSTASI